MASRREGPAVDRRLLARLRGDVGDETVQRYADAYLALLRERLDLVERAVGVGERAEALRALTDLRIGAAMLGAETFAAQIARVERAVRTGTRGEVTARFEAMRMDAEAVAASLQAEAHRPRRAGRPSGRRRGGHPFGDPPKR
ncbi:MAG TPA: hypothetical protein VFU73_06755 [Actinocrinis sp.]|nr:hypothetical protein [Actinocrinis sp.]